MTVIAISRGTFSGGKELAECIAERLEYRCLSREELLAITASQFGIGDEVLHAALDNAPGFLEAVGSRRRKYIAYLRAALLQQIQDDNVVYHGQVGHLLLVGIPHVLKVNVIADMGSRIKAVMDGQGVSRNKAIGLIRKADDDRAKWVKSVYNVNWQDPSLYDMVINLEHMSIISACDLVVNAALTQFRTTPASQRIVDDLVFSTDLSARIAAQKKSKAVRPEAMAGTKTVSELMADLASDDVTIAINARRSLVAAGREVVDPLIRVLASVKDELRLRREATRTLGYITDARAIPVLVEALHDEDFEIRWLSTEALVNHGHRAMPAVLRELLKHPDSPWFRLAAHHILRNSAKGHMKEVLQPVLSAIDSNDPYVEVPPAAKAALDLLRQKTKGKRG